MTFPTSLQNLNRKISGGGQHLSAVVHLGQLAQSEAALAELMKQAAALIAQMLAVDYISIWELDPNQNYVTLQAGIGWNEGFTDNIPKPLEPNSLESFTLKSQYPITIENLREEIRFNTSNLSLEHGLVSCVSLPMGAMEEPLGLIEAFGRQPHVFSAEDCLFLQGVANILGLAIARQRAKSELTAENDELRKQLASAQSVTRLGYFERDSYEIKRRLSESRERERLRLAQELHDLPIQDLYGLIYQVDELKDFMQDPDGQQILHEHNQMLNQVVNNLRTICRDLRPPSLSPFGLEVAIRDHVEKLREQNPELIVHLQLMHDQQILSDSLRLSLFRIYQQAINNIIHHAEATECHIRFSWDEETIILEVEDNGKGFEVPQSWVELVRKDHFGLVGLAEHAESIGGRLEVTSTLGDGTMVRAIVPRH
jgi:signal transduction histidine kinase